MYKILTDSSRKIVPEIVQCIVRIEDNATIPMDEGNRDYQAYLEWIAEGNTPESADEETE